MATTWHLIGQVRASTYREAALLALSGKRTPAELHQQLKRISRPHLTRALKQLHALGLVTCLTPDTPRYHLYQRTKRGEQIARALRALHKE